MEAVRSAFELETVRFGYRAEGEVRTRFGRVRKGSGFEKVLRQRGRERAKGAGSCRPAAANALRRSRHLLHRPQCFGRPSRDPAECRDSPPTATAPVLTSPSALRTRPNPSEPVATLPNLSEPFRTLPNLSEPVRTLPNLSNCGFMHDSVNSNGTPIECPMRMTSAFSRSANGVLMAIG